MSCFPFGNLLLLLFQEPDIRRMSLVSYLVMSSDSVGLLTVCIVWLELFLASLRVCVEFGCNLFALAIMHKNALCAVIIAVTMGT